MNCPNCGADVGQCGDCGELVELEGGAMDIGDGQFHCYDCRPDLRERREDDE